MIYQQANEHDITKAPIINLTLVEEQKLTYTMNFEHSDDVVNLLAMTPFAFKASKELVEEIKAMNKFTCQADFILRLYKK